MVRLNVLIGIEKITGCSVPQANEQNRPIVPWTSSPRLKKTIIKKLTKKNNTQFYLTETDAKLLQKCEIKRLKIDENCLQFCNKMI